MALLKLAGTDTSPRAEGRLLAARLLELGRLQACKEEELFVIEASPTTGCAEGRRALEPVQLLDVARGRHWPSSSSSLASSSCVASAVGSEEEDEEPVVETDLALEDYSPSGKEESWRDLSAGLPALWAPGSANGRRLMTARAKQCVICMEDKEHTLVPPHRDHASDGNLDGHRVCTDCWDELLQHAMDRHEHWQRTRHGLRPTLACPVCRADVEVPDAWDVEQELPKEWVQRYGPCARPSEPSLGSEPDLWADPSGCSGREAVPRQGGATAATSWPESCWQWLCCGASHTGGVEVAA